MKSTRRDRRDWRILISVNVASAIISICFAELAAPSDRGPFVPALIGIASSTLIANPIVLFELRSSRTGSLRHLRRLPLVLFFAVKALFYFVVIVGGLSLVRLVVLPLVEYPFPLFEGSMAFAVAMSVVGTLAYEMGGLLGFGTLKNLLTGHYVQPKREQRTFLLIDMKDSTG